MFTPAYPNTRFSAACEARTLKFATRFPNAIALGGARRSYRLVRQTV